MSLASLIDGNLEKYVSDNRAREGCWFFVHIPKTAGSSFRRELAEMLKPNYHIHVDRDQRPVSYEQKLADATKAFSDHARRPRFRFASGHLPIITLAALVEDWQSLKLITMLRDPVKRVISDYRYQTTPVHPGHAQFVEQFPTLDAFIGEDRARNKMFRFLRPSPKASLDECIQFVIERFAFVGDLESYDASFRLVTRMVDQEREPSWYIRKTEETEYNRLEITPEVIQRVRELNELDVAFYGYFRRLLDSVRDRIGEAPIQFEST